MNPAVHAFQQHHIDLLQKLRDRLDDFDAHPAQLFGEPFHTIAAGDSYNDTGMLSEAHAGILFRPPQNVIDDFPQFTVVRSYDELKRAIERVERQP